MNLRFLILLLGACFLHSTTGTPDSSKQDLQTDGILRNVESSSKNVNLSNLHIKSIAPGAFDALEDVESLDLSNNDLVSLPALIFSKLSSLKELSLFKNQISSFDNTFIGLSNLERLNISENPIKSLKRGDLFGLPKTVKIFPHKTLRKLSSGIFEEPVPAPIEDEEPVPAPIEEEEPAESTKQSSVVKFYNYPLKSKVTDGVVESLESQGVTVVELTRDQLMYMPTERDHVIESLSQSGITQFEADWYKIEDHFYDEIDLSWNEIKELSPELLNNLPSAIKVIDLSRNRFTELKTNDVIENVTVGLNFRGNRISTIEPGAFGSMSLLSLDLERNLLYSTAFARTLPKTITSLQLGNNHLLEFPVDSFYGLENLRVLAITNARIRNIEPGTFRDQKNLRTLLLRENKISELAPGFFEGLDSLKMIDLGVNLITKIPSDVFEGLKPNPTAFSLLLYLNDIGEIGDGAFSGMNLTALSLRSPTIVDDFLGEGPFDGAHISEIRLEYSQFQRFNGKWFKGVSGLEKVHLYSNKVKKIEKGLAEYMQDVTILSLWSSEMSLENGALFGISTEKEVNISFAWGAPIKIIEGGVFDDV